MYLSIQLLPVCLLVTYMLDHFHKSKQGKTKQGEGILKLSNRICRVKVARSSQAEIYFINADNRLI